MSKVSPENILVMSLLIFPKVGYRLVRPDDPKNDVLIREA